MRRHKMFHNIVKSREGTLGFDDLYQEISHDWQEKAERLQERRWRRIRDQAV